LGRQVNLSNTLPAGITGNHPQEIHMTHSEALTLTNRLQTTLGVLKEERQRIRRSAAYRLGTSAAYIKLGNVSEAYLAVFRIIDDHRQKYGV
jgi:hypothetical protein